MTAQGPCGTAEVWRGDGCYYVRDWAGDLLAVRHLRAAADQVAMDLAGVRTRFESGRVVVKEGTVRLHYNRKAKQGKGFTGSPTKD